MLRVSPVHGIRHHHGCNGFEPCDGLSGLVQPPYMRIASRQKAISGCPARMFLERSEQHRRGVVKAPGEKVTRRRRTVQARSRRCALYMYRIRCTRCRRLARRVRGLTSRRTANVDRDYSDGRRARRRDPRCRLGPTHRRRQTVARCFGGSVFQRRVGSDQGPKNFEKALDGAARAKGLHGDASAFAQEEQFVGEQLGIA